jgi:hypothetical protein
VYVGGTFEGVSDFDNGTGTFTMQPSTNRGDIFIVKLTTTGNFVWARQLPGSDIEYVNALTASKTGEVYLTGLFEATIDVDPGAATVMLNATTLPNSWYDVFLLKLDANGNYAWHKQLTGDKTKTANGLYVDGDGKVLMTGTFYETVDFDPSPATYTLTATAPTNIYILQLDASGNFVWVNQMGGLFTFIADMNTGKAITQDAAGNIYTVGKFAGAGDMNPTSGTYTLSTSDDYPDMYITRLGDVVGLNDYSIKDNLLQLYPNPTNGQLKIKDAQGTSTIKVYNALGSEVLRINHVNNNEFNLSSLPKGVYFVEISNGNSVSTRKIIKE